MRHFCTLFDSNYLLRGLTLFRSLERCMGEFRLYALALDEECLAALRTIRSTRLVPVALPDVEAATPGLLQAKANRSVVEYYFTLSPVLPLHILEHWQDVDLITYLDADLFFFASPEPIFEELGTNSILITEHRFPAALRAKEVFGQYNVQYQTFRRDDEGLACLRRWRAQCLEWCYDRLEAGRFADQKYLEEWPVRYPHLVVSRLPGAGVAPWNWSTHEMQITPEGITVMNEPLIFYHFHALKIFRPWLVSNGLLDFGMMPFRLRRRLYCGYVRELRATREWIEKSGAGRFELRDRFKRHKLAATAMIGEVARKAWAQSMLIP